MTVGHKHLVKPEHPCTELVRPPYRVSKPTYLMHVGEKGSDAAAPSWSEICSHVRLKLLVCAPKSKKARYKSQSVARFDGTGRPPLGWLKCCNRNTTAIATIRHPTSVLNINAPGCRTCANP